MTDPLRSILMQASEQIDPVVEWLTGIRQKFIDQGWTPASAEQAAIEVMLRVWQMPR